MVDRIFGLMEQRGVNDVELAKATGVSNKTISAWRRKLQKPSAEALIKIADYFGVTTDYLLKGSELQSKKTRDARSMFEKMQYKYAGLLMDVGKIFALLDAPGVMASIDAKEAFYEAEKKGDEFRQSLFRLEKAIHDSRHPGTPLIKYTPGEVVIDGVPVDLESDDLEVAAKHEKYLVEAGVEPSVIDVEVTVPNN